MSSNIRIKKVCKNCGELFTARTTVTQCCSDTCAKAYYKKQVKEEKRISAVKETSLQVLQKGEPGLSHQRSNDGIKKEFISRIELSAITGLSERTIFRLMKDDGFPRLKIGRRVLFRKDEVINYLTSKYGNL